MPDTPSPSQTDRVVLALRELVLQGAFAPEARLKEVDLAARLRASRTPIRHALVRLAHEGLLEAVPTGGFRVRRFTLDDVWDAIELRGVLEGMAARLAAERLSNPADLEALRRHQDAMEPMHPFEPASFAIYLEINEQFHREIWRLSRSRMLEQTIDGVVHLPFAAPGALVFSEAESVESRRTFEIAQAHHRGLVEAIADRAGTRAEALAREHATIARMNLRRALADTTLASRIPGASLLQFSTVA